jgi:hypothetical protein
MITREFLDAELASLEQERNTVSVLLHKLEAGITIYKLLLEKFDGSDLHDASDPRSESSD